MRNAFAPPAWTHFAPLVGFVALAAVVGPYLIGAPPAVAETPQTSTECQPVAPLLASMAQYKIGVVARGLMKTPDGSNLPVSLFLSQKDGSWLLLGFDPTNTVACIIVDGPLLQLAPAT